MCILSVCRLFSCILVCFLLFGYQIFYGWAESSIDHKYPAPVILPFLHRIPGGHAIHLNFACISVVSPNPFPFPFSALSMLRDYIFILFLISLFPLIRGAVTIPILFLSPCMSFVFPWKALWKKKTYVVYHSPHKPHRRGSHIGQLG